MMVVWLKLFNVVLGGINVLQRRRNPRNGEVRFRMEQLKRSNNVSVILILFY